LLDLLVLRLNAPVGEVLILELGAISVNAETPEVVVMGVDTFLKPSFVLRLEGVTNEFLSDLGS